MHAKICRSCVLPGSTLFPLDSTGRCSLCNSPGTFAHILKKPDRERLHRLIDKIKRTGKDRKYDCVVAWSGGRDSTYMLHELVTRHGLRCVAVYGRTPFTPAEITENVRSISRRLEVDVVEVSSPSDHQEIASFCLREYLKSRKAILVNLACASCKLINREIFAATHRLGVRTVVYGGNRFEYFPSGPASVDIHSEERYSLLNMVRDNLARLVRGAGTVATSPALLKYGLTFFEASLLYLNQYTIYLRIRYPGILRCDYFHYAEWDEGRMNEVLAELGWKLPPGCTSTWRADCVFEAVKNTAFKGQLGFTYAQALYSNLIRGNKISRDEALERLKREGISEPRLQKALELCGMNPDSFAVRNAAQAERT